MISEPLAASPQELLTMSKKERDRSAIMQRVQCKSMKKTDAAKELDLSYRQVLRLYAQWVKEGDEALVSKKRGVRSNYCKQAHCDRFLAWYADLSPQGRYKPKHASEMFEKECATKISKESARCWLQGAGYHQVHHKKEQIPHPSRKRRSRIGEMIQIDGSEHCWLGGYCFTLLQFIDDATSQVPYIRFVPSESTNAYMAALEEYVHCYGIPRIIYSDRHGVFYNNNDPHGELTQFGRALQELEITPIPASTPQARGRVERAHQTAQERLVREMANLVKFTGSTREEAIAAANEYLPQWLVDRNQRFSVAPRDNTDAHLPVTHSPEQLRLIFSTRHQRKLSPNGSISYEGVCYTLSNYKAIGRWRVNKRPLVNIYEHHSGERIFTFNDKRVDFYEAGSAQPDRIKPVENQEMHQIADEKLFPGAKKVYKPSMNHPWKAISYEAYLHRKKGLNK